MARNWFVAPHFAFHQFLNETLSKIYQNPFHSISLQFLIESLKENDANLVWSSHPLFLQFRIESVRENAPKLVWSTPRPFRSISHWILCRNSPESSLELPIHFLPELLFKRVIENDAKLVWNSGPLFLQFLIASLLEIARNRVWSSQLRFRCIS